MSEEYKVGETLIVQLKDETLVGDLKHVFRDNRMIELANVRDFNSGFTFTAPQTIPTSSIRFIKKCLPSTVNKITTTKKQASSEQRILISNDEIDKIHKKIASATYIFQSDQSYFKAVEDIRNENVVSLHIEPFNFARHSRTSLIALGTPRNVYIFDLISLGKIFKELKLILESESPKKIVYYSNKISDILRYRHKVELSGIFDIFVAHCLISKQKDPLTFSECATKYLNMPDGYFQTEEKSGKGIDDRPIAKSFLVQCAKKVIYLYRLYDYLLHEIMLEKFFKQCKDFSLSFKDDDELPTHLSRDFVHGVDRIGNDDLGDILNDVLNIS